jgi:hypothetical protein
MSGFLILRVGIYSEDYAFASDDTILNKAFKIHIQSGLNNDQPHRKTPR